MPETGVTLRFRMEGYEAIQDQLEEIDDTEDQIIEKTKEVERRVKRSLAGVVAAMSATVRLGVSVLDVFGITIDKVLEQTINLILSYAQQLSLAAMAYATSPITAPYAVALATIAATLQARAIQLQAAGATEAKAELEKSKRLMDDLTTSILIMSRIV